MILRCAVIGLLLGCIARALAVDPVDGATVEDIANNVDAIESNVDAIDATVNDILLQLVQDANAAASLRTLLEQQLGSGQSGFIGTEVGKLSTVLRQFLVGTTSDTWYTDPPQFRYLQRPLGRIQPGNAVGAQSLTQFLTYTLGQNVDYNISIPTRMNEWETFFTTNSIWRDTTSSGNQDYWGYSLWNVWLAEAQRRQLAQLTNIASSIRDQNVTNSPAWNTTSTTEELDYAVADYTNSVAPPPDDTPEASAPAIDAVLPELDWQLETPEPSDVRLFGFDEIDPRLSGTLSVQFTEQPWPVIHGACQFAVAVLFVCGMVAIVRSEWDYWSTLGGSAT